ncbi:hypothetical protein BDW69DRAFT_182913 [Aspergillus filifer]
MNMTSNPGAKPEPEPEPEPEQEPLSATDYAIYNRLAEKMSHIHKEFRSTWRTLKTACSEFQTQTQAKADADCEMDDTELLMMALSFVDSLSNHHSIEEKFIFPALAARMPEFAPSGVLVGQHEIIHDGLVRTKSFLRRCERFLDGEADDYGGRMGEMLDRGKLLGILEGENGDFERVLWCHLDEEVEALRAENMRLYWGAEEIRRLPM